jgi:hypothetical protein
MGQRNIVGFLVTGSGVKQFLLSLRRRSVPRRCRPTATPARAVSLPRSGIPATYQEPAGMIRSQERDGSRAVRTGDAQDHVWLTLRWGYTGRVLLPFWRVCRAVVSSVIGSAFRLALSDGALRLCYSSIYEVLGVNT